MQQMESRTLDSSRLHGKNLAVAEVALEGEDGRAALVVDHQRILRMRDRVMSQRGIHARNEGEEADDEKDESLEEAFHGR